MKNKVKFLFSILILVSLLVFMASVRVPTSVNSATGIQHNDIWSVQVYRNATGTWEVPYYGHNTYTNAGKNATRDLLGAGSATAGFKYIALGNLTAPTVTSTTLAGENTGAGLDRTLGTYYSLGQAGNWTISNTFTSTQDDQMANTTGLFNDSTGGVMLSGFSFTDAPMQTNDQVTINATHWTSSA